jgi:uroporphyrin-III C-methyltransferase/precorrin-2 dehydrogenase/sirohydrochlorin ferrochelatase
MYPVMLCLERARCLVVGGGEVALRKVEGLLRELAEVTVVAPDAVAELQRLVAEKRIAWKRRPYSSGDPRGYRLVLAATDRRDVNRQVRDDAEAAGIWVNVADDPELCTFHLPARVERGPLQIAVSSGGKAPFTVRRLRERFERWLDPAWGAWADAAARYRALVRERGLGAGERESRFNRFFDETVAADRLDIRVPGEGEMSGWLDGAGEAATLRVGFVSLVGAGPGNGGLLTLRAHRRLRAADAVVYDRLAEPALPCDLPRDVELHAVGKEAGNHPVPQDEINALLVRLAQQGKRVVRFKGGDPYVFGRGGEEALALFAAGIRFEVIPGVSTGVAGPAFAGIPVTQRGVSSQVTFFTANRMTVGAGSPAGPLLAPPARQTLVGFMGVHNLGDVTRELAANGVPETTPAMLIERATTARQRCVRATVASLVDTAAREEVVPPALLVVGEAVRYADRLGWHGRLPLAAARIALAAPAGALGEALELAGAEVLEVPLPATPAAMIALAALPLDALVVRSARDATGLCAAAAGVVGAAAAVAVCSSGEAAGAARAAGWRRVEEAGAVVDAAAVTRALGER